MKLDLLKSKGYEKIEKKLRLSLESAYYIIYFCLKNSFQFFLEHLRLL
jgi:hypothetical protein